MDKITNSEYIYLIRIIDENYNKVYKIGRTSKDIFERLNAYKFKKILLFFECENSIKLENKLINILKNKYKLYCGYEYFLCDNEIELKNIVMTECIKYNNNDNDDKNINNNEDINNEDINSIEDIYNKFNLNNLNCNNIYENLDNINNFINLLDINYNILNSKIEKIKKYD
jgi:hypothetical protein